MLSVVTITFNNFQEFRETQESIQDIPGIERIVVNGGKCEQTREWLKNNPAVRSVSEPDKGIADAFNKGIAMATGDAIALLNSGDKCVDTNYYAKAEQILRDDEQVDFVHSDLLFVDRIAGKLRMAPSMSVVGRGMPFWHPTMVVRRSFYTKVGGFQLKYRIAMDYEWVCRALKLGARGKYLSESAPVEMDGGGVSSSNEKKALKECWLALRENDFLDAVNLPAYAKRLSFYWIRQGLEHSGLKGVLGWAKKFKYAR